MIEDRSRPVIVYASNDRERPRIATALRSEGLDVHETTGGVGAVAMAKASLPNVVVLDSSLSDLDLVIARLRNGPMTETIPLIVTSKAPANSRDRAAILDPRVDAYVADGEPAELAALVRSIVRPGSNRKEREDRGGGTPATETPANDAPSTRDRAQPPSASGGRFRVLLVDDNVDSCSLFEMALTDQGHTVDMAFDGTAGLERLIAGNYDVAVVDIGLPGLDGYELARRARAVLADRTPLLVAMTGYGRDSDRAAAQEAGFGVHLVKPVDIRVLLGRLEGALATSSAADAR